MMEEANTEAGARCDQIAQEMWETTCMYCMIEVLILQIHWMTMTLMNLTTRIHSLFLVFLG